MIKSTYIKENIYLYINIGTNKIYKSVIKSSVYLNKYGEINLHIENYNNAHWV